MFDNLKEKLSGLTIQTDFHSKFKVLDFIGKGHFGEVWTVEEEKTKKQYAAKQFEKNALRNRAQALDYLKSEIEIMKQIDHPNLAKLYEVHETQNSIYFILEKLGGGELFEF